MVPMAGAQRESAGLAEHGEQSRALSGAGQGPAVHASGCQPFLESLCQ